MRAKVMVLLGAIVCVFLGGLSSASEPTPAYSPRHIDFPGVQVVYHVSEGTPGVKSRLLYEVSSRVTDVREQKIVKCRSLQEPDCLVSPEKNFAAFSLLKNCEDKESENCVEAVWISNGENTYMEAQFVRQIGGYSIPADKSVEYVGGDSASIWRVVGAPHVGEEEEYLVVPELSTFYEPTGGKFLPSKFSLSVIPFKAKKGNFKADRFVTDEELAGREREVPAEQRRYVEKVAQGTGDPSCVFSDDGYCGVQYDFQQKARVKVAVRLSKSLGGWFRGRIQDPKIDVKSFSNTSNVFTVEGENVKIPRMVHLVPYDVLAGQEQANFVKYFWGGAAPGDLLAGPEADGGDRAFEFIDLYRSAIKDTAAGFTSAWNFSTVNAGQGSSCLTDTTKVLGVVTTNSMAYEGTAPRFVDGSLDYRVAGLHFAPDGKTEVKGTYDLIMRSETARCLYGFTNAPISATISVTSDSGENSIATTQVSEENGWLKLGAYNFTFSNPTVKVKLAQVKAASPVVAQKKKSITCVKGKTVKKVAGVNPKCPTGFRKR